MPDMIAKFEVVSVQAQFEGAEELVFRAVSNKPFDADGASDDNSFARWTPCGELKMTVQNPALLGQFKIGQKFYLNFTPAET